MVSGDRRRVGNHGLASGSWATVAFESRRNRARVACASMISVREGGRKGEIRLSVEERRKQRRTSK